MKSVAQTVIEADRFYTIAAKTGSVIQAVENAKDGGDIRLGKYDHKPEQEWAFIRVGDGVYRIRNRANGKLMDLMMTGTANGTWLHLWEDVGGTSQMWTMEHTPQGTVRLRSSDGAVLQIWQETAGEDQLWTIEEVKDRAKRAVKKAEPAVEATPAVEPVKTETAPVGEEKAAEPVAAPAVEEKPEVKEEAKTEEKPAEAEGKAEPAAEAPKAEEKPAAPAAKAPAKKPAAKKTSRAARKAASAKKASAKKK